jgi:hypothetical protein
MQRRPLGHHPESARRHTAAQDTERGDIDEHLVLAVGRMEVRRVVIVVEDADDDAFSTREKLTRYAQPE